MEEITSPSLDRMELHAACQYVKAQARSITLLAGMSEDDSETLVHLSVTFYIKARVRRSAQS